MWIFELLGFLRINTLKRKRNLFIFIAIFGAIFIFISTLLPKFKKKEENLRPQKLSKNYFLDVKNLDALGLLVNTSRCQIPNFSPWDSAIVAMIKKTKPDVDCKTWKNWTRMEQNVLVMKTEDIEKDGLKLNASGRYSCCFEVIHRIEQQKDSYNISADNQVSFSNCTEMLQERTKISEEFIMVKCSSKEVEYRGFHSNPQSVVEKSSKTQVKIQFWKQYKEQQQKQYEQLSTFWSQPEPMVRPPNILIIGLDSTSRLNFRRHMPETRKILRRLKAIEMLGYIKVGENTFLNAVPLIFGYSVADLKRICIFTEQIVFDDCPSIWKRLDAANYVTAHTEDHSRGNMFQHKRAGFLHKPVDFYPRPLILGALEHEKTAYCIGHQTTDEWITNYLETVMDIGNQTESPIFSVSWSTRVSHDNVNGLQLMDETYAKLFIRLENKGYLDNTILIFMSDHGYRYGMWRETLVGYYEDKLPNLWIRLPEKIMKTFPQWNEALKVNSGRLSSPFTLHWTLHFILDTFTKPQNLENSKDNKTGEIIQRKHHQNFFTPIREENSCEDIGTPEQYCPCHPITNVYLNDSTLIKSAEASILKINKDILLINTTSNDCSPLELSKITAGALITKKGSTRKTDVLRYIVGFVTIPGEFAIEAEVNYFPKKQTLSSDITVQRASKINQDHIKCIKDSKLELFCYCNNLQEVSVINKLSNE